MEVEQSTIENIRRRRLHIEVAIHSLCPIPLATLRANWQEYLKTNDGAVSLTESSSLDVSTLPESLRESCIRAYVDNDDETDSINEISLPRDDLLVHTFTLSNEEVSTEELEPSGGDDEWTAGCDSMPIPHITLDGLWESLIFDASVKQQLLDYALSALLFSDKAISSHIVTWNRILLLHGPPGTGKTSLCRGLAHKLAIRLSNRFPSGATLLEIHSHSLFSKWFSTSGKLVSTLFQLVRDMVQDDPKSLVCVLIDEVESLASARGNLAGGDPSDAMRAVNSLLTSLDRLRSFPNVIVLATTNLTGSVDRAFVDRVDLKIHIDMPTLPARYEILRSCMNELQRVGLVVDEANNDACSLSFPPYRKANDTNFGIRLMSCARKAGGLSGRSLRRLPLQAHAQSMHGAESVTIEEFLTGLCCAIETEHESRQNMNNDIKIHS